MNESEILSLVNSAWDLYFSGDIDGAIYTLENFQIKEPDELTSRLSLGVMYYSAGKRLFGRSLVDNVIAEMEDDANALLLASWVQHADGDKDLAIKTLHRAEIVALNDASLYSEVLHHIQVNKHYINGDYSKVIEFLNDLPVMDRRNYSLYTLLANSYYMIGDFKKSKDVSEPLITLNPNNPFLLCVLAESEAKLGNKNDAWAAYQRAFELDPANIAICGRLFRHEILRGRFRSAWRYLKTTVSLNLK